MVISLGWLLPATSRGLPAAPTTRAGSRCLLGLAPTGGYRATPVARRAVGSYPTFSPFPWIKGGLFSVARSVALRRPGVTWQSALWSSDFPQRATPTGAPRPSRPTATREERYRSWKGGGKPQRASRRIRRTKLSPGVRAPDARAPRPPPPAPPLPLSPLLPLPPLPPPLPPPPPTRPPPKP